LISFNDDCLDSEKILGEHGLVSQGYKDFEFREEQVLMAKAVDKSLQSGHHLAVEAGTGVGKSFAYLVPVLEKINRDSIKVVVSTYTIALQEQLINKDLPFLAGILPFEFTAVLAKGRGNYVCLRRLEYAVRRQAMLFDDFGIALSDILTWSKTTEDGSLSDLGFVPLSKVWDSVKSEHGNCRGRKCPHYKDCFYWRARRRLENADLVIANHALLFSDLALKESTAGILPEYRYVIIDEAHNIEHVAEDHFGINITNNMINFMLSGLYNKKSKKGLLAFSGSEKVLGIIDECYEASKLFFQQVEVWYKHSRDETGGRCDANFVDDNITGPLRKLRLELSKISKETDEVNDQFELNRNIDRCRVFEQGLKQFLEQPEDEHVYWVEVEGQRRLFIKLISAPINVGADVKRCLFDKYESVVLTSATLSSDGGKDKSGFEFFASRAGLTEYKGLKLGSPFDYEKQVTMYIEADLPNPNEKVFIDSAAQSVKKYLLKTHGNAFVLFTSYSMLNEMTNKLDSWCSEQGFELLKQGGGVDRTSLLYEFKSKGGSVLFGTDSFWQGVDVPGESLSNVIIVKLPFAVPNHPLIQGRIEKIRSAGGNPFFEYQLPSAVIKFKQGFGRLIRSKKDKGIIAVLDSRIFQKRYGKQFLSAVPKCKVVIEHSGSKA